MFSSFTNKVKSFFSPYPEVGHSRKRKRPVIESDDSDCEIIEVKRAKNTELHVQHLGYNFFSQMAEWVKNKTSWDKMFDFKVKDSKSSKKNGQFPDDGRAYSNNDKINGNGLSGLSRKERTILGQQEPSNGQAENQQQDLVLNGEDRRARPVIGVVNGDHNRIPADSLMRQPVFMDSFRLTIPIGGNSHFQWSENEERKRRQAKTEPEEKIKVKKMSYASAVRGSNEQPPIQSNGNGSQRSLFPQKKADIHFTANETVRLDERERYKMLLQQYTHVPLKSTREENHQDSWPSLDRSRARRLEDTILSGETRRFVTKIDTSKSKPISRVKVTPSVQTPGSSLLQRRVPAVDVMKSASFSISHVQSPSPMHQPPLLESTRVPEMSLFHETIITEPKKDTNEIILLDDDEEDKPVRIKSPSHDDYRKCQYLSETWRNDLISRHKTSAQERERKIKETETKLKVLDEMRKRRDEEMARGVELQMRISVKEPAVIEDLPVEFSEEEEEEEEEDEEEEVLPELTPEMDDVINKALRGHPPEEVLVEGYRLQITRGDIATLAGLNWLNDEVINFYMNMLMERGEKDNYPKCYAFNTFFYPKIMSGGQSTVKRWTRKVDIFSYDYILIPVHLGMHWCICIVDFKKKVIRYYDSMGGQNIKCLNAVKQYLCDECKEKKNQAFDVSGWSTEIAEDIPQQMNGSDCGMFACKFAEYVTREAKISFEQKHMPYFRRRMVYEIVTKKLLQ